MSDTINIGGITVSKFYLGGSSDVKIYLGSTKLYPHLQEPCFAVVDNISTYTARTYVDVYETSSDKWYKLNNLNAYEEYGIYGSGRTITYYEGKLTIDGDYEYQYSGNSWVNVGEVSGDTHDYSQDYLTLQALESGTIEFSAGTVDYSTDSGSTWNTLSQGNTISVSQGDEVLFKKSVTVPDTYTGIGTFTSSCRFNVYGNIMSMQEGDNFATATTIANYDFYFKRLFAGSKVVSAANMVLPATTLQNFCYNELFNTATYLTIPPKIFPATALTQDCYSFAFNGCTSLTKSPVLPALTAARASYGWMFQNCTSLSEVSCLATDVSAEYATYYWLSNVASSGTFYKNPNASWSRGTSGIPSGWNVEDYVEPTPSVYPVYYDEMQDPPNYLSFSSMTEAEEYECPWVGMKATIAGSGYTFNSNYEWEYIPSRLPVGYTEVQYIENFSNTSDTYTTLAYINTNFYPTENTRTIADIKVMRATMNPRYFGSGNWNALGYIVSQEWTIGEDRARIYCKYGNSSSWIQTDYIPTMDRHVYDHNNNGKLLIDNVDIVSLPTTSFTCTRPMAIFTAIKNSGSVSLDEVIYGRLYSFKVYENGTLVRDLVPCTRDSDSKAGVYDIVNDVFYQSANSNSLIAGPTV